MDGTRRSAAALMPLLVALLWPAIGRAQSVGFTIVLRAQLEARTAEGAPSVPLPLADATLRATIEGQHATTTLRQTFTNASGTQLEGRYVLRPSIDARVSSFAYYIGEERIVGEVFERQAARAVYDAVTAQQRDPAILEQTAEGEFAFRVFPILPGERKRVEIGWQEWLPQRAGEVMYRAPLGSPTADAEIVIADVRARDVRSSSHRIDVEPLPRGGVRVRTREAYDTRGELVLRWAIEEPAWSMSVHTHRDPGHAGYFLLSLAAPARAERDVIPKDVTLVLDHSGSMSGAPIEHARLAAQDVIQRLGPHDRVNVIAFDDDVDPLFARPRPADVATRADALSFVSRLAPGGGTDIAFALRRALEAQEAEPGRPRVVIFFTDGQSAAPPVLEIAEADRRDVRVYTVGLGSEVNRPLLSRLASTKRGTFTFIADASRIEAEVGHLYGQIARPVLVDLSLTVEGAVASRIYPRAVPDLFAGGELILSGRLRAEAGPVRFVLRGRASDQAIEITASADAGELERPWVARRWASARVDDLIEEMQLKGEQPELRAEATSLAIAYDFVTPYTAFLAIPERELTAEAASIYANAQLVRQLAQAGHPDAVAASLPTSAVLRAAGSSYAVHAPANDPSFASRAGCASCTIGSRSLPAPWPSVVPIAFWIARRRTRRS